MDSTLRGPAPIDRLDRQLRIDGWDQGALEVAKVGVAGGPDMAASLFILSAAALGINNIVAVSSLFDERLTRAAREINPELTLAPFRGGYVHPAQSGLFSGAGVVVDLSRAGLTNKLLILRAYEENVPVVRGLVYRDGEREGIRVFTYKRGREWKELEGVVSPGSLPPGEPGDPVLSIIAAGIALEETKNILMGRPASPELITFERETLKAREFEPEILVVGAGALGNFVGLGLACSGFSRVTFLDPDVVETTNLNRQVFFANAVGKGKAETLAERLNRAFGASFRHEKGYFNQESDLSPYDAVLDCVDNFETRVVLSEKCRERKKMLISGGTDVAGGQVVVFHPDTSKETPAEFLGLHEIVERRKIEDLRRDRDSCVYRPDPSVIMPNQIVAGFMVDALRMLAAGHKPANIFYDSKSERRL